MAVSPVLQQFLDLLHAAEPDGPVVQDVAQARSAYRTLYALLDGMAPAPDLGGLHDRTIPGPAGPLPVRVYHPDGIGRRGVLVWFHGGGWVIGDLETADRLCRRLCVGANVSVVSVDYRLAPEHPYPAAVDDAWAAVQWVAAHGDELEVDSTRLAVGGDSAGGNLAALCALRARDLGDPALALQLLVYPGVDLVGARPSIIENGTGRLLTKARMDWFMSHYLGDHHQHGHPEDPAVSPLYEPHLAGVAPAMVVTAGLDPLRDEGDEYATRLAAAGVEVVHDQNPDHVHLMLDLAPMLPEAAAALQRVVDHLRTALA